MAEVRRSRRTRKQIHSIYDDAKERSDSLESVKSSRKAEEENEPDEESIAEHEEDVTQEDSSSDEDEEPEEKPTRKRKAPTGKKSSKGPRKIQVRFEDNEPKKRKARATKETNTASRRAIQTALNGLTKKVLDESETPDTSLVAALLQAHKSEDSKKKARKKNQGNETIYTAQLEKIALRVVQEHHDDPNKAQVDLFNLLFRSVGGSIKTVLDPKEIELENVSDEEWTDVVTHVLEEMQVTPVDCILLCADPKGAAHAGSKGHSKASVGAREYRKIYEEFWYKLGTVALSSNLAPPKSESDTEDDSDEEEEAGGSSRFQVELARDIISRLIDLVGVGQPDIRAAATIGVYKMAIAMLERTVELTSKLDVSTRQYNVAKRSKMSRKAEALKVQIDTWKRTIADLEEVVKETVMGVFMKRYRDSNMYIRADSLKALSSFTLIRPDIFLASYYLKYFGWLLSDKDAIVREHAIYGLLEPFREAARSKGKREAIDIDTSNMRSVVEKFAPRLADCVIDVDVNVQEKAMELLLVLSREGLLDTLDDDEVWEQINLRALAEDTTPAVRHDALFFVIEQLEAFDAGSVKSEAKAVEQINAIAGWIAHNLSDSDIQIEHIRFELADYVVASLRTSSEYKSLVCNWSAVLKALQSVGNRQVGKKATDTAERRQETVQQRVLLRMLVCSAELEVRAVAGDGFMEKDVDADLLDARNSGELTAGPSKKKRVVGSSHEELTIALLRAIPGLLTSYKSETSVLQSLTGLPQYFLPSVFNLPNRKKDFDTLLSKLSEVFLESTDRIVLQNCALVITTLAKGDHARSGEALLKLKKVACSVRDRLSTLLGERAKLATAEGDDSDNDDEESDFSAADTEHAIALCLRRLGILSKRWYISELLVDDSEESDGEQAMESLCTSIAEVVAKELRARKVAPDEGEAADTSDIQLPKIWTTGDNRIHGLVAESVSEALAFLLSTLAWAFNREVAKIGTEEASPMADPEKHVVLSLRDGLVKLLALCFEQYVEEKEGDDTYSEEHIAFANTIQECAGRIAGDLRSLFPKELADADSSFLRACALTNDAHLIGGFVRFLRSQEQKLRMNENAEKEDQRAARELLLPLARGLSANWKSGNRREAGVALSHITNSGHESAALVSGMSRVLKKIEPVRLLEAHMACLRQDFEDWAESEPELEKDHPTEEEMAAFEEAEKQYHSKFEMIENQAQRLSASLGVGKLSDKHLAPALLGFVKEGVRFAFSTKEPGYEEELPLGAQLPFLRILSKYLNWIRRDPEKLEMLRTFFNRKETDLRNSPDFRDVYDEELAAIKVFRRAGDLGEFLVRDEESMNEDDDDLPTDHGRASVSSLRRRMSGGSSVSSIRSKLSTQGSLSPLMEEDPSVGEGEEDESPPKRRKLSSMNSSQVSSTLGGSHSHSPIDEGSEESSEAS